MTRSMLDMDNEFSGDNKTTYYFIYKTTNTINGKFYIGKHKTKNLNDKYLGSGILIRRALNKYGRDNFQREIILFAENEKELASKEKELITVDFLKNNKEVIYNIAPGGQGGDMYANHPENRKGTKNGFYGKKHSDKTKKIIGDANRGENNYLFGKKNERMSIFN